MDAITERLVEQIGARLDMPSVDPDSKHDANRLLRAIAVDLDQVLSKHGYEDFLLEYLKTEVRRNVDDPNQLPDDVDARSDPLCTCSYRFCGLKQGELPVDVHAADSIDRGIREFKADHRGNPIVLEEARSAWREKRAHVRQCLGDINALMANKIRAADTGIDVTEYGAEWDEFLPPTGEDSQAAEAAGD